MFVPEFQSAEALRAHYKAVQQRLGLPASKVAIYRKPRPAPIPEGRDILRVNSPEFRLSEEPSVAEIIAAVSKVTKIPVIHIKSKRRDIAICEARQVVYYLAKTYTKRSLPLIGRLVGGVHHSTIHHAVEKIGKQQERFQFTLRDSLRLLGVFDGV